MDPVLVGFDGDNTLAVDEAADFARMLGRPLEIVVAVDEQDTAIVLPDGVRLLDGRADAAGPCVVQLAERRATALAASLEDVSASAVVAVGKPADVLIERATETGASVIVVGSRTTLGARRAVSPVADEVVHRAPCTVHVAKIA